MSDTKCTLRGYALLTPKDYKDKSETWVKSLTLGVATNNGTLETSILLRVNYPKDLQINQGDYIIIKGAMFEIDQDKKSPYFVHHEHVGSITVCPRVSKSPSRHTESKAPDNETTSKAVDAVAVEPKAPRNKPRFKEKPPMKHISAYTSPQKKMIPKAVSDDPIPLDDDDDLPF